MKTNVIVQNTIPPSVKKKIPGTVWIRPVNAALYTINEDGRMFRSSFYLSRVNYREGYNPGIAAFDDLFLNGLKEKMASEGDPIMIYVRLIQMLKEDSIAILGRGYLHPVTNKPYEFYETAGVADIIRDMCLSVAKFYDSNLEFEAPIDLGYLQQSSQLEAEQPHVFNLPNGAFYGEKRKKISQFLLAGAEASRIFAQQHDNLGYLYILPTVIQGQHHPSVDIPNFTSYLASLYDRAASAIS